MFHEDVAKVDQDVAYVAMAVYVYCKCLLPMFYLCFSDACCKCVYLNVAYVSRIRCMCFICLLHMVAVVFKCFQLFFSKCFRSNFQVLDLPSDVCYDCCI